MTTSDRPNPDWAGLSPVCLARVFRLLPASTSTSATYLRGPFVPRPIAPKQPDRQAVVCGWLRWSSNLSSRSIPGGTSQHGPPRGGLRCCSSQRCHWQSAAKSAAAVKQRHCLLPLAPAELDARLPLPSLLQGYVPPGVPCLSGRACCLPASGTSAAHASAWVLCAPAEQAWVWRQSGGALPL